MGVPDIPMDFKIEHDRLVYLVQPLVNRLFQIMKSLPNAGTEEILDFTTFTLTIKEKS